MRQDNIATQQEDVISLEQNYEESFKLFSLFFLFGLEQGILLHLARNWLYDVIIFIFISLQNWSSVFANKTEFGVELIYTSQPTHF
jgi:hypothetical protein